MKRLIAALVLTLACLLPAAAPIQADSIVQLHIYDYTTGWDEITARPATLLVGHYYFVTADAPAHAGKIELNLGLTSFSPYWTHIGHGCSFGGNGSGTYNLTDTKVTCTAGSGGNVGEANMSLYANGQLIVSTMTGRTTTPSGNDSIQYSIQ